jgi:tetratricopeptide (TPR) repeat protein
MEAEQAFHRSIGVRRKAEGVPDRSEIASCLLDLARTLAVQDKYDEAEKACREAIALHRQVHGDTDVRVAEDFELLAVVCNRQNKRHQELLQEFPELETIWSQQTVDYLNSAAWRLATEPNPAARIPELAVKLAQRAVQRAPDQAYIVNTLGTAYYRASDWNAAIETLKNADELYQGRHFSFDAFFIAMSHWQLGDKEAARKWYGAAARWQEMFEPANDELRRFRAEAAALLGLSDQPAAAPRQHSADERELYAIILDAWPEAAWVHLRRGLERDSLGESQQAQTDYRRALELYDRVVERKPNVPQTWVQRGLTHACLGQWDKSTSDLDKAVALGAGPAAWYQPALTRLVARDLAAYREACDRILVAIGKVENGTVDDLALWTCALAPELGSDLDPAIAIAERMVREDPNAPQRRITLGALLYRDGRFAEAVSVLEQASGQSQNPNTTLSPAYPAFFLAMAHHRMGHQDEAATWLAQGRKLSDEAVTDHQAGTSRLTWNRRLTLNLLRREAEQLVEQKQTSDE